MTSCSRCRGQHAPDGLCVKLVPVERVPLPEWRNDHGAACCCMSCLLMRGARRQRAADELAAGRQ